MKSSSLKIIYGFAFQAYGLLCYLLARIFFRIRIYGQEKILSGEKQNGLGCIFVSRHWSCWDPVLLWAIFWKFQYSRIKCVAKDNLRTLFKCFPFLSSFVVFINQKSTKRHTIREMIDLLREGISIAIFPEGTIVPKYKKIGGLVSLIIEQTEKATDQKITVFPLKIEAEGYYGKPQGKWLGYLFREVRIIVKIGDHLFLEGLEKMLDNKENKKEKRKALVEELLNIADKI